MLNKWHGHIRPSHETVPTDPSQLYDDHATALHGFLMSFTRSESDTRDTLQEVFLKLARQPSLMDAVRDPRGWLLRMAHHTAVDLMRRRQSRENTVHAMTREVPRLFAVSPDPDVQSFREALTLALAELPAEQRVIVHLKLWEERTFSEIAEMLEIPLNTAASRYRYGLAKLQTLLRPIYEEL